jgi:ribonuclease P protein component
VSAPAQRETGRAGFVIGRKVLPLAVDRNRLRRLLRVAVDRARPAIDGRDLILRLTRRCRRDEIGAVAAEGARLLAGLKDGAA